ncbi:unnamed protein product [Brassica rapa]|uniref:Uncharacterized protein n=1 Tax=Brassica campestris TaxID=3711 RepID=A0A8D9I1S7_BRACM|nr:unnamed protein product [Brassica rapa]
MSLPFITYMSVLVNFYIYLIFTHFQCFSDLEDFSDDLVFSRLKYNALDDFQEIFQKTSSRKLFGSLLTKSSSISS